MQPGIGIYIHVPFCEAKCRYCSFYSLPIHLTEELVEKYVNEVIWELIAASRVYADKTVSTVYIGGGTPSVLNLKQLSKIVNTVYRYYHVYLSEFTIEVNPSSSKNITEYAKLGINRISVGVQSTDDGILKKLGRIHTVKEALQCLEAAASSYDKISGDIILGVEDEQNVLRDVKTILPYVNHISTYILTLEKGTPLYSDVITKKISVASEDAVVKQYNDVYDFCVNNRLYRYEVSNFAYLGAESKHNLNYWSLGEYIGFGPGAHSYMNGLRFFNESNLQGYLAGNHFANHRQKEERPFSIEEDRKEFIMLAMRTAHGIDATEYGRRFGDDFWVRYKKTIDKLKEYMIVTERRIRIKPQFFLVQNAIIGEFLDE
ncbi:MAG: radical SAM family heme chaperone HemW [Clostridia bacterium]|nr:radical SAM family heme chaperone HemW [Clostridia bacterium]